MDARGSATAELATGLPALVLSAGLAVWLVGVATTQLRCLDAARAGARAAARGEPVAAVVSRAREATGLRDASVEVRRAGDEVAVGVRARAAVPFGPLARLLPRVTLRAVAHAVDEGGGRGE